MITATCFRSLFLLLTAGLFFSCIRDSKSDIDAQLSEAHQAISEQITASQDNNLPPVKRRSHADKAVQLAVQSKNDYLVSLANTAQFHLVNALAPDSLQHFLQKYQRQAKSNKDTLNLANAQGLTADHYANTNIDSAFWYHNAAKINYEFKKDSGNVAYRLLLMADIYRRYNDFHELERSTAEAMQFVPNEEKPTYNSIIYNNFGIASRGLFNYDDAVRYYENSAQSAADQQAKYIALNNLAVVYIQKKDYPAAMKILSPLYGSDSVSAYPETKARIACNFGDALIKSGQSTGISLLLDSEQLRQKIGDSAGIISSRIRLAEAYASINPLIARKYAQQAYATATLRNSPDDRMDALRQLINSSNEQMAKPYFEQYTHIQDSVLRVRQSARNQFAKIRYDFRKATEENVTLKVDQAEKELQLEKKKSHNNLLYGLLFFIVSTGTLLYLLLRKKHRREKIHEGYKAETRIAKKLHDELANDVFHTIAFAETQDLSDAQKKETLLNNLDSIYARSRDISRENSLVDTGNYFPQQLREMLSEYNSADLNVIIHGLDSVSWQDLPEDKKIVTYRILQELMVNMKKHSQSTLAAIRFKSQQGKITVEYSDNGVGMPLGTKVFKNGLRNVENRINGIGGTLTFDPNSGKGLKIAFAFSA